MTPAVFTLGKPDRTQAGSSTIELVVMFVVLLPVLLGVSLVGEWFDASAQMQLSARHAAFHAVYTESGLKDVTSGMDAKTHLIRQTSYPMGELGQSVHYNGEMLFELSDQPVGEAKSIHKSGLWSSSAVLSVLQQVDLELPALVQVKATISANEAAIGRLGSVPGSQITAQAAFPTAPWSAVSGQDANDNLDNPLLLPASRPDFQLGLAAMAASNASLEMLAIPVAPKLGKLDFWADIKPDRDAAIEQGRGSANFGDSP